MNGEGQRPPAPPEAAQASADAPEPGNSRYPQPGLNGNGQIGQATEGQGGGGGGGGGRRRFRRNRRGGRGRRGKGGQGQGLPAPLDAQGRIVDVENDQGEDSGPEESLLADGAPAQQQPAAEGQPPAEGVAQNPDGVPQPQAQQSRPQRHGQQQRPQQQPR